VTSLEQTLLEKLMVVQWVKKFPAFYGTWRFTATFTKASHIHLTPINWIQHTPSHHVPSSSTLTPSVP
jgi:hypothetical protein